MNDDLLQDELFYTDDELRSYLPSGWSLAPAEDGERWDPKEGSYRITVIDEVDHDWPVEVSGEVAAEAGRLEALQQAMDRTQRGRLGWRTKGLLGWRLRRA